MERNRALQAAAVGIAPTWATLTKLFPATMLGTIWKSIPDLGPTIQEFAQSLKRAAKK